MSLEVDEPFVGLYDYGDPPSESSAIWHEGWQAGVADATEGVLWIVAPIVTLTFIAGLVLGWWLA